MASIRKLPDELQKIAIEELNEVPERIPEDLEAIRKWLSKQTYLKSRTDDQFLITFLRGCKFSLERTKEKLDTYYTIKTVIPEFFENRDPDDPRIKELIKTGVILPLPFVENKNRILISRLGAVDPSIYNFCDVMKISSMFSEYAILINDQSVILGNIAIIDMAKIKIGLLAQLTPQMIKKVTSTVEALPLRIKALHYVNPPPGFETLFKLFSGFVSEKMRNRLFIHDTFEKLHQEIPKNQLPQEYGGDAGSVEEMADDWYKQLSAAREYFLEESKYGTIERLRPGLPKTSSTLFGVDGSFRSLNID